MTKTIQKVRTVVVVLMKSCHVSEKLKIGPVSAQMTTSATEPARAGKEPAAVVTSSARTLNRSRRLGSGTAMNRRCSPGRYKGNDDAGAVMLSAIQTNSAVSRPSNPEQHESRASADGYPAFVRSGAPA